MKRLTNLLATLAQGRAIVSAQDPLRLAPHSEPEPDLMLLKPRADFYSEAHPGAQDVLLLIEVCDTTVRYDREVKLPLYARHGVAEVWLIDLEARTVEICCTPLPRCPIAASWSGNCFPAFEAGLRSKVVLSGGGNHLILD